MAHFYYLLVLICFLYLFPMIHSHSHNNKTRISLKITERSNLIGTKEQTTPGKNARHFFAFRGIPYAEPPINENRWTDPKPVTYYRLKYDATAYGSICTQYWGQTLGSEDCLFVNVFTPKLPGQGVTKKPLLPVMLYVHGGGYTLGSSNAEGPRLLMKEDVVMVTFNYRLGVFGYLSTGNKNLPGNYGALDQIAALDWVQKYIHKFGGDPKSVTVFGHSAGGAASHLLAISPLARGKVHKAILQSGTALGPWIVDKNPGAYTQDFASRVGCTQKVTSSNLIECLKKKTTEELISAQKDTVDYWLLPITLQHVVDKKFRGPNAFLPEDPEVLMDKGLFAQIPIMAGVVEYEGIMGYSFLHVAEMEKFSDTDHFRTEIVPRLVQSLLRFGYSKEVPRITEEVLHEYFPGDTLTDDEKIRGLIEINGDNMFYSGQWNTLQKYMKKGLNKVYSYVFTHQNSESPSTVWNQVKELRAHDIDHPLYNSGFSHVDDMYYLFEPCELFPSNPDYKMSAEAIDFSEFLTGIWAAFAKNGSPAEGLKKKKGFPEWKPIDNGFANYYNLTPFPSPMGGEFHGELNSGNASTRVWNAEAYDWITDLRTGKQIKSAIFDCQVSSA